MSGSLPPYVNTHTCTIELFGKYTVSLSLSILFCVYFLSIFAFDKLDSDILSLLSA